MSNVFPPRLSELLEHRASAEGSALAAPTTRRRFLARASSLSLAIPGVGAALTACSPDSSGGDITERSAQGSNAATDSLRLHNSNSRLDTALHKRSFAATIPLSRPGEPAGAFA